MRRCATLPLMVVLLFTACTRSASTPVLDPQMSPTIIPLQPSATTAPPSPSPSPSTSPLPPTATLSPTIAPPTQAATASGTATLPPFEPAGEYGSPTLLDTFADDRYWADANGELPNTDFIQLALESGHLKITGKPPQFDTWWFTSASASNYFVEMEVNTGECSGKQAYGLILRGPQSNASARGYILTFSCDGAYRLVRLDGLNPYTALELIPWTENEAILAGPGKNNLFGVGLIDETLNIYANNILLQSIDDDRYSSGRFGVFVNAGLPGEYTFSINQLAFWNLD